MPEKKEKEKLTVLVTGATGTQGGAVARTLLERGHRVRALTRDPRSDAALALQSRGAELVEGDFAEPPTLTKALDGADAVYAMTTPFETGPEGEVEEGKKLVAAAKKAKVGHVVLASVAGADQDTGVPHFDSKREVEAELEKSKLAYTVVAPVFFMENLFGRRIRDAMSHGRLPLALPGDRPLQMIAVDDIAGFAVRAMEERKGYEGKRFEVAGDELTPKEAARTLSRISGHPIRHTPVPLEMVRQQSEDLAKMFEWLAEVGYSVDIPTLRDEHPDVGWKSFEAWVRDRDWGWLDPKVRR